jgi:hypothetical protein
MKKLFLLVSIFAAVGCNKEQDVSVKCGNDYYPISSLDVAYAKFKQGTYWVYLDSITMNSDSTVINSVSEGNAGKCEEFQAYGINLVSYPTFIQSNLAIYFTGIEKNTGGLPNSGIKIYTDFNVPDSSSGFKCSRLDSVFIYDRYYKRVEKVIVDQDPSNTGKTKSVYYFNNAYGLLRHDIYNASSALTNKKLLIRKNIVR